MPHPVDRIEAWAAGRSTRVRGVNPFLVALGTWRRFSGVRVPGLAAEMAYFGLVSLVPFLIALGAGVGFLGLILGPAEVQAVEDAIVRGLQQVFSPDVTAGVIEPLVRGLLAEERTGTAIVGLLLTFLFASGVFRAVIRVLDDAYAVPERRSLLHVWGLAYLLALASVGVIIVGLSLMVVGPLLGGGHRIAEWLGLGRVFEVVWSWGRWPVVLAMGTAFLAWVYTAGPNVRTRYRDALPGAVLATTAAVLIAVGLRVYLQLAGPRAPEVADAAEAVQAASQTIGAVLAVVLWIWLTGIAVLVGGVLNTEILRQRGERPVPQV